MKCNICNHHLSRQKNIDDYIFVCACFEREEFWIKNYWITKYNLSDEFAFGIYSENILIESRDINNLSFIDDYSSSNQIRKLLEIDNLFCETFQLIKLIYDGKEEYIDKLFELLFKVRDNILFL